MNNVEGRIVAKFGGTSLASAERIEGVLDIIRANSDISFIVPSAPGKENVGDKKITDLLIACCNLRGNSQSFDETFEMIRGKFTAIGRDLGYSGLTPLLNEIEDGVAQGKSNDWVVSRGEWLNGHLLADCLDARFVDPTELIRFRKNGQVDERSYKVIGNRLRGRDRVVIPGFYGLGADGQVKVFRRGGSDITGAIIARGINAIIYENWTDVNGVLSASPKVVQGSRVIENITYREIRELGIRGTEVLQSDTIIPLVKVGIPIHLRNTFDPESLGTRIVPERPKIKGEHVIGITGQSGFMAFNIQKYGMNDEIGIGRRVLKPFSQLGISYEHNPSGRDDISVIVNQDQLDGLEPRILGQLQKGLQTDKVWIQRNLGLLSVVGQGIPDHAARVSSMLLSVLNYYSIPVRAFSFGASGISMVVAVDSDRIEEAIKVSHRVFIER